MESSAPPNKKCCQAKTKKRGEKALQDFAAVGSARNAAPKEKNHNTMVYQTKCRFIYCYDHLVCVC
ncbi:hypothetical protein KFK09_002363 [Dendrobium nobile]|uniref:Uncharacterized protein n=1 Tax=Dendrobium nobile TaxID=94219 RepID=A0A8T3C6K1_DENNO|nr:hypothetical protein KFK09_002363 [Dendrobium nobile]